MIFADRKYVFVYAMRLSPCAGCGGKFIGRDLYTVVGWPESLTFFEGGRLCRVLGSRVPLSTLLSRYRYSLYCLEEVFSETELPEVVILEIVL